MRLGAASSYDYDMGSLISEEQLEAVAHMSMTPWRKWRYVSWWEAGRGRTSVRYFYEPTLLGDVRAGMSLFADETFGPVAAVSLSRTRRKLWPGPTRAASG